MQNSKVLEVFDFFIGSFFLLLLFLHIIDFGLDGSRDFLLASADFTFQKFNVLVELEQTFDLPSMSSRGNIYIFEGLSVYKTRGDNSSWAMDAVVYEQIVDVYIAWSQAAYIGCS